MWRRVIGALRDEYRLLAPDLRGFGWSEAPGHGYDGETFAADQVALLDALGIERAFVIGHDWGGWTAVLLGLLHPDRVERMLVLQRAASVAASHPRARRRELAELVHVGDRNARARPLGDAAGLDRDEHPLARQRRHSVHRRGARTPTWRASRSAPARSRSATCIATTSAPFARASPGGGATTGCGCRRDSCSASTTATCRPGCCPATSPTPTTCEVELVPDSGHFVVDEKPDLVVERARAFFG